MAAFVDPVVIDELVIRPLCPALRSFIVLAGRYAHCSRNGDVGDDQGSPKMPAKPFGSVRVGHGSALNTGFLGVLRD